jgi:hypothetical protein
MATNYTQNLTVNIDVNSQSLEIVGGKITSLQGQLRFLIREQTVYMQQLANATAEEANVIQQKIDIINRAIEQTRIQVDAANVKNKEFFQTLAIIPGPLGQIAGQTQMWVRALRDLSQLSLKDVLADIKLLFAGSSVVTNPLQEITRTGKGEGSTPSTSTVKNIADIAAAYGLSTAAFNLNTAAGIKNTETIYENAKKLLELQGIQATIIKTQDAATGAITGFRMAVNGSSSSILAFKKMTGELTQEQVISIAMSKQQVATLSAVAAESAAAAAAQNALSAAEGTNTAVAGEATAANWTLSGSLMAVNDVLVTIGAEIALFAAAFVAALTAVLVVAELMVPKIRNFFGDLYDDLRNFTVGIGEMEANVKKVSDMIDDTGKMLELDLDQNKRTQNEKISSLKKSRESEKTIREQGLKDIKDNLDKVTQAHKDAKDNIDRVNIVASQEYGFFGRHPDQKKYEELVGKAVKQEEDLNKKMLDLQSELNTKTIENQEASNKESFDRKIRNVDAKIEYEIKKEKISITELKKLYTERNNLFDSFYAKQNQRLTPAEVESRETQQTERILKYDIDRNVKRLELDRAYQEKNLQELSKGTEDYFKKRTEIIESNYKIEMERARVDITNKTALETIAVTNRNKALKELEIERMQFIITLRQEELNGLFQGSQEYYDKERELEQARYDEKVKAAKDNAAKLEAIRLEHEKKLSEITGQELEVRGNLEKAQLNLQKNLANIEGAWWTTFDKNFYAKRRTEAYTHYARMKQTTKEGSEARKQVELEYKDAILQIDLQETNARMAIYRRWADWTEQLGNAVLQMSQTWWKGNKDIQHGLLALVSAAQIAKVIIDSQTAVQAARAAAAAQAPIPGAGEIAAAKATAAIASIRIGEAISIASIIAATVAGFAQIDGSGGGGTESSASMGRNYGDGGMIYGPSHGAGGVPINAEGGEAVMTRGAVTMFRPLLSMMNQMGGGTSFTKGAAGMANFDNPKTVNVAHPEQPIIKTYIVQSELTSQMEKTARLKSLSTL